MKAVLAVGYATLLIGTPIALINYLKSGVAQSWHGPQYNVYVIWLSLERIAAVGFLGLLAYSAIVFCGHTSTIVGEKSRLHSSTQRPGGFER